jgi:hypothetical protein
VKSHFSLLLWSLVLSLSPALAAASSCAKSVSATLNAVDTSTSRRTLSAQSRTHYMRYFESGTNALEEMRGESGLIFDKVHVLSSKAARRLRPSLQVINANTSPTNIGFDILLQLETIKHNPQLASRARKTLNKIFSSLEKMDYHQESGLFFSWYDTSSRLSVKGHNVSSVDNIHLALALWVAREEFPGQLLAGKADKLFRRMDFSTFLDPKTGLIRGELAYRNGQWEQLDWTYSYFGTEARTIYALGWALDLFKKYPNEELMHRGLRNMNVEFFNWQENNISRPILKTWDGGAFQLLLPKTLLGEELYSPTLKRSASNYADYILSQQIQRGLQFPAAHSASNFGLENTRTFGEIPWYNGHSGSLELLSTGNQEALETLHRDNWDKVFTPHAAFLAAAENPERYAQIFSKLESYQHNGVSLFHPQWGWMDGVHVKGRYNGQVIPVVLSLDHSMIQLATSRTLADDRLSISARALRNNAAAQRRLSHYYRLFEERVKDLQAKIPPN